MSNEDKKKESGKEEEEEEEEEEDLFSCLPDLPEAVFAIAG